MLHENEIGLQVHIPYPMIGKILSQLRSEFIEPHDFSYTTQNPFSGFVKDPQKIKEGPRCP